jgi:hypothetical protein
MINAREARARAQMSNETVDKFIEALGKKIEEASDKGLFEYKYHGGMPYDPTKDSELSMESYLIFKMPQFWELVKVKLTSHPLNYAVNIGKSDPYVPRGLSDDQDNGPQYISYHLVISW